MSRLFGKSATRRAPAATKSATWLGALMARLGVGRARGRRADDQRGCYIECLLHIGDDDYRIPGYVLRLSSGGALFRPESAFLMRRNGEAAALTLDDSSIAAVVYESAPAGYHLRFPETVPTAELREWLSFSGREDVGA